MSNPSSVVAGTHFSEFVLADDLHDFVVRLLIVFSWDLGSHTTHGVHTSTMAGLDKEPHVGVHERHRHRDTGTVWKDEAGILPETLDDGEYVIPAAAVETRGVVA